MSKSQPKTIYLKDYSAPDYFIEKTELEFDLFEADTLVRSKLTIARNTAKPAAPLVLNGQNVELVSVAINGEVLSASDYTVDDVSLTISNLPDTFIFECVTKIQPQDNTSLEGLYKSRTMFCTQCEAEGFRKITYYLDRPDVMSVFTTKVIADKQKFPVLLSNGNEVGAGELDGGRHWVEWNDPFKKPAYLFALVAGDLINVDSHFTTQSGREILLRIFIEPKDKNKCDYAMQALKNAMRWDEDVYGREYDLDIFMIVAVDDFNMGAMENKGLNIFNTSCVLASPETTTDAGYQRVEGVVAHEYFHNWSGNRVTCRDWFQLSLKEGFTVFRDEEFSADMGSPTVKRVEDVSMLRSMQFAEDAGPMAHPVQPSSFIEISNFYTLTVYEKGAEVVRMIRTLIGAEQFRKGSDLYFERHDGQAVTIEDFVAAMADASGRDFSLFMNWYKQAGTPKLSAKGDYNAANKTFSLTLSQSCPPTPESQTKQPFHIPVAVALLGKEGALKLSLQGDVQASISADQQEAVLELTSSSQTFVFENVDEPPVPSLLRGFSAPVKLAYNYSREELGRIITLETDGFCRWDASQQYALLVIADVMAALVNEPAPAVDESLIEAYRTVLTNDALDPAMIALMLSLPSEDYIGDQQAIVDVDTIHHARNRVVRKIALSLHAEFLACYNKIHQELSAAPYSPDATSIAKRSLKNKALAYLVETGKPEAIELCKAQFEQSDNMTDTMAALTALVHSPKAAIADLKAACLAQAYGKWKEESLAVNQWFAVQATSPVPGALAVVESLMQHEAFDIRNPNKLRAVIGGFAMRNSINFHDRSGSGYAFLADQIIKLDSQNPQVASRLLTPLTRWKKYDEKRQQLMRDALQRILDKPGLSPDVYEVVTKSMVK
ncbi:aminopeptidase N [Saccharophagus degradans]|uniref:Aminopeptidase N n=1 Tax=Saccharophagus degradans (strain 2-40 / ATCC 43961 / DSM 17024) TaxID=203122 RepID=Q21JY2_SACD2|nr:aminopeptidase N [Saccharophagus degradans]ABD80997.1 alanyl aminopeptidase. Metallo peptidase. MEROPS family M01 [Saccharophagus degradans 2-40]